MEEASKGEILVADVGEGTLATVLNFIYTGELELGDNPDILELTRAGDKYLLSGFVDHLGLHLQKKELPGEMIADLLITANLHGIEILRKIALDKVRVNKQIFNDPGFRKVMKEADPSIMMDLYKDL